MPPVFRFAPSPNGYLHLGHAYSALLNFDCAREAGGRLLLRIEDIDADRCRPEFETAIYQDLAWLGIAWKNRCAGNRSILPIIATRWSNCPPRGWSIRASKAAPRSRDWWRSREANAPWPRDPDGAPLYPGTAKSLTAGERARRLQSGAPYALRLDMAAACARAGDLTWIEHGEGPEGETGDGGRPAGGLGRRHPRAQGDADQLSPRGRDRRRPAGRDRGGAGCRTCSGRPACTGCCNGCSACRSRPTGTTA